MFEIGLVVFECSRQNHNAYGLLFYRAIPSPQGSFACAPKQKWRGVVKADFEFVQDLWTFSNLDGGIRRLTTFIN